MATAIIGVIPGAILISLQIVIVGLMILIFFSGIISGLFGAPYVPMSKKAIKDILSFGGLSKNDILYDLGCGDGRVLICGVREFGVKKAVGYEISPWPFLKAKILTVKTDLKNKISLRRCDLKKADLSDASFVYLYLFPKIVDELASKMAVKTKTGTKILSSSFPINAEKHPEFSLLKSEKIGKIITYLYEKR